MKRVLLLALASLALVSCSLDPYKQSLEQDKIRIERQREDLNKRAKWFQSLTPEQQDSVKRLYNII